MELLKQGDTGKGVADARDVVASVDLGAASTEVRLQKRLQHASALSCLWGLSTNVFVKTKANKLSLMFCEVIIM
eukprot:scaffold581229_cov18-Prasinocladus_malaysianus.AAC.1